MTGITENGFEIKTLEQLVSEGLASLGSAFGSNFNFEPENPDVQISGAVAESLALLWEVAQDCYNSFDPRSASDDALEALVALNNLTRKAATKSRVELIIGGTTGTVIPAGSRVSTSNGAVTFETLTEVTIQPGTTTTEAEATQFGPLPASVGTVTVINDALEGWTSVNNATAAVLGRLRESNTELRARRALSVANGSTSQIDAIFAAVSEVAGVSNVLILENDTTETVNGVPPNSLRIVVTGGLEQAIIDAIGSKKTPGIPTSGEVVGTFIDSQGSPKFIRFARPTFTDLFIVVELTKFPNFPSAGTDDIKTNLVEFINALGDGATVVNSQLYTPINEVQGHSINRVLVGDSANPTSTNDFQVEVGSEPRLQAVNVEVVEV